MTATLSASEPTIAMAATERIVTFAAPVIGFASSRRYALRELDAEYAPYLSLHSLDVDGLSFIAVAPGLLFDDYVVEIPEADVALLELESEDDVEILALVTSRPGSTPTVNLMGPIVLNRRTLVAAQLVLADPTYGVAVPVDARSARHSV